MALFQFFAKPANSALSVDDSASELQNFVRKFRCSTRLISVIFVAFGLPLQSCDSRKSSTPPTIEFTKIPPATEGGRDRMGTIAGRVSGAQPGQQIVLYARSGPWWVQPRVETPFTAIHSDSSWSAEIHLGFEYAALLVDPDYHPPSTMDVYPTVGGSVVAVKTAKGEGALPILPTKPIRFSGYDWTVRTSSAVRGGVDNLYDPDNAWVDPQGALHLRIRKKDGKWTCAMVLQTRSFGYGTYAFTVRDVSQLEPAAVLSAHTYDQLGGDQHYREMDIEISRWGDSKSADNIRYGLVPLFVPANIAKFSEPAGVFTHSMFWQPGQVSFKTTRGSSSNRSGDTPFREHVFKSGVPTPGQEQFVFMFYVVPSDTNPLTRDNELVIDKFDYLP
jgi:hypothetical protein